MSSEKYWSEEYWQRYLSGADGEKVDFLQDLWLDKYKELFGRIPRGRALDLGCGLGQFSQYLVASGFDVIASDISKAVLDQLQKRVPAIQTAHFDMAKPFPFDHNSFQMVFANLSIHYFAEDTTTEILQEIQRVLVPNGYFVGRVNSTKTLEGINEPLDEIAPNYFRYKGKRVRHFDRRQFEQFFTDFEFELLEEVTTARWGKAKTTWEFIARSKLN